MPFQEKSAWVMTVALILSGAVYFILVLSMSSEGYLVPLILPVFVLYTVLLVVLAIIGHIVIALLSPKEANSKTDERERLIKIKSSHLSGYIFAVGIIFSLFIYMFTYSGSLLFYAVFASLMIGQIMEYIFQLYFHRRSIR